MDTDVTERLAEWISENQRRQGALEILFRRLVTEVDALAPGARDRVFAQAVPPPGKEPDFLDDLNALIHEISGADR